MSKVFESSRGGGGGGGGENDKVDNLILSFLVIWCDSPICEKVCHLNMI